MIQYIVTYQDKTNEGNRRVVHDVPFGQSLELTGDEIKIEVAQIIL